MFRSKPEISCSSRYRFTLLPRYRRAEHLSADMKKMSLPSDEEILPRFPVLDANVVEESDVTWQELLTSQVTKLIDGGLHDPGTTIGLCMWLEAVYEHTAPEERWCATRACSQTGILAIKAAKERGLEVQLSDDRYLQVLDMDNAMHEGMLDGIQMLRAAARAGEVPDLWSWTAGPDCGTIRWVAIHLTILAHTTMILREVARTEDSDVSSLWETIKPSPSAEED